MRYVALFETIILITLLVMGSVIPDTDNDQTKIIFIELGIHKTGIDLESVEIHYGHPPNLGHQCGNFTATVRARNGTSIFSFDVWDPQFQIDEYGIRNELEQHELSEDPDLEQIYRDAGETADIDLPLIIPYQQDIQTVDLVDKESGSLLISVNISPAMDTFHSRFPRDPDMMENTPAVSLVTQVPPDNSGVFLMTGSILALMLMALLIHLLRRS